jgi:hypothetical protein
VAEFAGAVERMSFTLADLCSELVEFHLLRFRRGVAFHSAPLFIASNDIQQVNEVSTAKLGLGPF